MRPNRLIIFALALIVALPAFADDQAKAQKELNQITAMARDLTGRTMVNLTLSQTLKEPRMTLVQQRMETGLNYGSLFLASELVKDGATMPDVTAQLKSGKKIAQIANDRHANWKAIAEDAKKVNSNIGNNLYKYFLIEKNNGNVSTADPYDVHHDGVAADAEDVSDKEIAQAGDRFTMAKNQAEKAKGDNKELSLQDERIGYADHTGSGPGASAGQSGTSNTSTGSSVPGFGGPQ